MLNFLQARPVRDRSACPCFLIAIVGTNITVSGAVFTDVFSTQTLTDLISVVPRPTWNNRSPTNDTIHRIARLFRALRICIEDLDKYYAEMVDGVSGHATYMNSSSLPHTFLGSVTANLPIWPHVKTFDDGSGHAVQLGYKRRIGDDRGAAAYVAEVQSGVSEPIEVVVRFAYKYNREAHELLAAASPRLAPRLRFCKRKHSVGLWVIVTDYTPRRNSIEDKLTDPAHVDSLRAAIKLLHENGFVLGDLVRSNIAIVDTGIVLLHLDWCGKEGETCYPLAFSPVPEMRYEGVGAGKLIKKEHDAFFFQVLTGKEL